MRVELAAIRLRASLVASKYVCICFRPVRTDRPFIFFIQVAEISRFVITS